MQSDSASRKRPFLTGLFSHWILLVLLIVSRVDFYSFCALPRGDWCEGVLLYSSRHRLAALCFALSPRTTARRTLVPAGVALGLAESRQATFVEVHSAENRQSYSSRSRCWQHGIETARCCRRVIHAAGEQNEECATLTCCEKQQLG